MPDKSQLSILPADCISIGRWFNFKNPIIVGHLEVRKRIGGGKGDEGEIWE
jgi:hypothetical protein